MALVEMKLKDIDDVLKGITMEDYKDEQQEEMEENEEEYFFQEVFEKTNQSKVNILDCEDIFGLRNALKDLITLSGVLKDLGDERFWKEPKYVMETMRTFNLILKATNYIDSDGVAGPEELVYRYEREYGETAEIDIPRLVRLCRKFNWVVDTREGCIKYTSDGKRMVLSLFRIANDSLDFHLTPAEMKYLYLARRDIELAGVYEDKGIGEHDILSSIVANLEDAVQDIERQSEMYISEGHGLEKYEAVYAILKMLEKEIESRYNQRKMELSEGEESQRLQNLYYRSYLAFQKAFRVLAPFLGDIGYASQFGMGRKVQMIDRESFLNYLINVFSGHIENYEMDPMMILEQLEYEAINNIDEEEDFSGIFCPFNIPPIIHDDDLWLGIGEFEDWIYNWDIVDDSQHEYEIDYVDARKVTPAEFKEMAGGAFGDADELEIDTGPLVEGIKKYSGDYVDNLLNHMGKKWWQCGVNLSLLAVLHGEREVRLLPGEKDREDKGQGKEWTLKYPDGKERFIKATAKLGRHLKKRGADR